ncbi:Response regulator c-di-GMP phosphodiesterase, RpfG family, contains REC and HD-GYP domains [Pseudobutyrivibrio sp. 49]|uniref:HD-GYP domain-containing protein n=1 Tax=Pseudobutyrivibrio sp. 49 TaxID=1855344 RepID=UPI0008875AFE|nr:HD domain-containing phosphohydrolase [Pseudobutyrivibrio sp. 49]SDH79376.1 Response regulator c-di-GMP phosphodiesterase, RpfG family, contains REC and HD-GYP domains [Pseudobutyrivibrio sp. 49]
MKNISQKIKEYDWCGWLFILIGIAINVLLAFICSILGLPLFLDTIGTILVSCMGGLLPGIFTALLTNALCTIYNGVSMYFAIINIFIAILAAVYEWKYANRSFIYKILFVLSAGLMSGGVGAYIQWHLFLAPQNPFIANSIEGLISATGFSKATTFFITNTVVNIFDKGISIGLALNIQHFIPEKIKQKISISSWKQTPLTEDELVAMRQWGKATDFSMRTRLALLLFGVSILVIAMMSIIELRLYYKKDVNEKAEIATSAATFAASIVDPEKIDEYITYGETYPGYKETEDILYKIRENAVGVAYLYLVKIEGEDMVFIFDLDASSDYEGYGYDGDAEGIKPGERIRLDEEFLCYVDDFHEGKVIPPTESDNSWSWIMTAFIPVFDSEGNCVCYAGADVSMSYVAEYVFDFMWRILLIMASIVIAILGYGIWSTGTYLVYPISSIGLGVESFVKAGDNQVEIDNAVRRLRKINIHTNDEIEKLYHSICNMALNQAEQIRSIRNFNENTAKMQDGLIITMADLVENRDVNSGSHIQKTAAYVKIIAEGLEEKGYYPGKVTPKFISDVVRSAPLHDIGKINVPDSILNKEGVLTPEEEEIKRTHTIAGKKIMENAITTVAGENYLKEARNMAAYHHENWDGTGYPEGLHGEVIPLSARIMAVADTFDVITSSKVKGVQYSVEEGIEYIKKNAGTKFDPKCVEAFVDSLPEIRVVYRKYNKNHG